MFSFESLSINKPEAHHVFSNDASKLKVTEVTINQTIIPISLPLNHHCSIHGIAVTNNKKSFVKQIPILKNGERVLVGVRFMVDCSIIFGILCEIRIQIDFKNDRLKKYITVNSATVATPSESLCIHLKEYQLIAKMRYRNLADLLKPIMKSRPFEKTLMSKCLGVNDHNQKPNKSRHAIDVETEIIQ